MGLNLLKKKKDRRIELLGNKTVQLQKLERLGFNVPRFFVYSKSTLNRIKSDEELYKTIVRAFKGNSKPLPKNVSIRVSTPKEVDIKAILDVDFNKESLVDNFRKLQESVVDLGVDNYSIIVQKMVYGDFSDRSCSGLLITKNPFDIISEYHVKLFFNKIERPMFDYPVLNDIKMLEDINPLAKNKLDTIVWELKKQFKINQSVDFVVQGADIFILQTKDFKKN